MKLKRKKVTHKYDSQLSLIFSCEIIRDKRTQASLQYAFIEFDTDESCERAYFKMDNGKFHQSLTLFRSPLGVTHQLQHMVCSSAQ